MINPKIFWGGAFFSAVLFYISKQLINYTLIGWLCFTGLSFVYACIKDYLPRKGHTKKQQVLECAQIDRSLCSEIADMIRRISLVDGEERASKCGYDLFMGLAKNNFSERYVAWSEYLTDKMVGETCSTDEQRDGVWVPAIPLKSDLKC